MPRLVVVYVPCKPHPVTMWDYSSEAPATTQLLERAITEARKLPGPTQDAIAALILKQIADDRAWDEAFARSQDQLARLAAQAREVIAAGRVRPLAPRTL